ncbi:hypothetical protein DFH28DRAFT_912325 [Melampsora americana]|nr:hypothetical protein DFH28DRAFT_912325 [Melampsora americana]
MSNASQKSWSRPGSSKRKSQQRQTPAIRQKLEHDKAAEAWCKKKCDGYLEVIKQDKPPRGDDENLFDPDEDEDNGPPDEDDAQIHHHLNNNDGQFHEQPDRPPQNMAEFVKADTYKRRRVREELAWNKYLRPMLIAYLRCSHITSEWGNPLTWNHTHFREEKCYCLASEKKSRCLDVVDRETRQKKVFDFCSCTPDQVRLISQGYLGGSPTYPQTAFSIRHIRSYHLTWKHRPIGVQPYALAHDEYLDAFNPLILIEGTNQPRQWRRPMACAVHAYRLILKARDDLEARALHLSSLQKLATLCPQCFGPGELSKCADEPDYIICLDGNFQHKRHSAASREFEEIELQYPPLFLNEDQVQAWDPGTGGRGNVEIPLDPCTAQHTAAADRRCATTFQGFDDNGLMGMACRHDQFLAFINIVQSGEKSHFAHALIASLLERIAQEEEEGEPRTVGVLYDIGCTLEKGLLNVCPLFDFKQMVRISHLPHLPL